MASDTTRPEVIDSDGHVVEPDTVWSDYAEPEFRDRLDHRGGGVQALGISAPTRSMPARADAVEEHDDWAADVGDDSWDEESRHKMARPGGYDPDARLVDMDAEGIDVAVLYPTSMLTWVEEAESVRRRVSRLQQLAARLLLGGAEPALRRRRGAAPGHRRCDRRDAALPSSSSAKAVMLRPAAYIGDKKLNHPDYDPFWAAAAELGCPIGDAPVAPRRHGERCRLLGLADGDDQPDRRSRAPAGPDQRVRPPDGGRPTSCSAASANGIPELRVAFLEGTGGWIVPMLRAVRPPVRDLRQLRPDDRCRARCSPGSA